MFTLLVMYIGTRFLSLVPLDELLLQSILGRNIRRHQPFDYYEGVTLSINDPRPIKEQATQNVLAHWMPRFIVDLLIDLVLCDNTRMHTLTYKDPETIMAPLLANHLEKRYSLKPKPRDQLGQTNFFQFRHLVVEEYHSEEIRDFITIPHDSHTKDYHDKFEHHFKLSLQACHFIIRERIDRSCKYLEQNLTQKYARKKCKHNIFLSFH